MSMNDSMRRALEAMDVDAVRKIWEHVSPHLPQPVKDSDVIISMHHARTQANSVRFKLRAYSHRWLVDNGYPSGLPDELKPKAERIYPRVVEGVGISVNTKNPLMRPVAKAIQQSMSEAVEEAFADGRRDPAFVSARMREAGDRAKKFYEDLIASARCH